MSANKKVLISGYYGFDNFGDELILSCISTALKQWGYEPVALSSNPEKTLQTHQIEAIGRIKLKQIIDTLNQSCAFISGGGGLFQDSTSFKSPLYYGALINLAYQMQKPVAFWGQGIGPLTGFIGNWITVDSLKRCQLIMVRDEASKLWVETHAQKTTYLMADSVWGMSAFKSSEIVPPSNRKGLAISLRPDARLTPEWLEELALAVIKLEWPIEEGVSLIIAQEDEDRPILKQFAEILKTHSPQTSIEFISGLTPILKTLANSTSTIAMRLHAGIVSLSFNTPTLAINYDPKVEKMAEMAEVPSLKPGQSPVKISFKASSTIQHLQATSLIGYNHLKDWLQRV